MQGFKWNEKFNDVNSSESINFLQGEIIPLLIERLNLSSDELHDVRLMKLFKGSVQSELEIKTKKVMNQTNFINKHEDLDTSKANVAAASKLTNDKPNDEFNLKIIKGFDVMSKSAHKEIVQLVCLRFLSKLRIILSTFLM